MLGKMMEWLKKWAVVADLLKIALEKGKDIVTALPTTVRDYLKQTWMLWLVIAAALFVYQGDLAQFAVILYILAPIAAVLLILERVLDPKAGWGLFPGLDLSEAFKQAMSTPLSCALVILGMCGVMISLLVCSALIIRP